jgi:pilus assembly protein CpaB
VTPAQAENLDLARSVGTLSLVLRNQVDPRPGVTDGATKSTLLGLAAPVVPEPAPPAAPVAPVSPRPRLAAAVSPARHCVGVIAGLQRKQECL